MNIIFTLDEHMTCISDCNSSLAWYYQHDGSEESIAEIKRDRRYAQAELAHILYHATETT